MPPLDAAVGALCRPYLQPTVPRVHVEIDAQAGRTLPASVVDHLVATLRSVVDKPGGITLDTSGVIPGGAEPWTVDRIREVAAATRDTTNSRDVVVIHVLSLAGEPAEGSRIEQSIGVAFAAGEFAVFGDRIDGLALLLGGSERVLQSVVVHELGHLLCLVNLGYTSDVPREDPQHPGHSLNQDSVMFHAIETTAIGQLFTGPPPRDFDAADLADLAGLREGRY